MDQIDERRSHLRPVTLCVTAAIRTGRKPFTKASASGRSWSWTLSRNETPKKERFPLVRLAPTPSGERQDIP